MFGHGPIKREPENGAPASEVSDEWSRKLSAAAGVPVTGPSVSVVSGAGAVAGTPSREFPSTVIRHRVVQAVRHGLQDWRILAGAAAALVLVLGTLIAASTGHGRAPRHVPPLQATPAAVRPTITVTEAVPGGGAEVPFQPGPNPAVIPPPLGDDFGDHAAAQPRLRAESPTSRATPSQVGKRGIPRAGTLRIDDF
jgi:hypothetical protein